MAAASIFTNWFGAGSSAAGAAIHDEFYLRSLPAEDVYLFVKRFDNAQVVRAADPAEGHRCWQAIAATMLGAVLLIGLLLPSAYRLLAGYQLGKLQTERRLLERERAELQLEEARLLSPQRLEELARAQQMIDPEPETVQYLTPAKGSLALNFAAAKAKAATSNAAATPAVE